MLDKHTTIYVEVEEEITSIIERIKKTPAGDIALVVPRRSFLSQGVVNLKILKSQSEKIGKQLVIVTRDTLCRSLARKVGIDTSKKLNAEVLKITEVDAPPPQIKSPRDIPLEEYPRPAPTSKPPSATVPNSFSGEKNNGRNIRPNTADIVRTPVDGLNSSFPKQPVNSVKRNRKLSDLGGLKGGAQTVQTKDFAENELGANDFSKENSKEGNVKKVNKMAELLLISRNLVVNLVAKIFSRKRFKRKRQFEKRIFLPKNSVNLLFFFVLALIVVISLAAIFILPKAEVKIVPKKKLIVANIDVQVMATEKKINLKNKIIPGKQVQEEIEEKMSFEAAGPVLVTDKSNKIRGNVTVYNEFSSSLEVFVAHTRFMTDDGLVFRSVSSVRLPGYTKKGDKIIPGKTTIEIVADKEGDQYQINQQKLTVPGLRGGARYEKIYAMVEEPFKELDQQASKTITEADVKKAKEEVSKALQKKAKEEIAHHNSTLAIDDKIILEDVQLELNKAVGSQTDTFEIQSKAIAKVLAYSKNDLEELLDFYLAKQVPKNQIFLGSPEIKILDSKTNEEGEFSMEVHAEQYGAEKMNVEEIDDKIQGLSREDAIEKLQLLDQVETAEITCWPFWARNVPSREGRVEVDVVY
ncbi:MAG: hypothetical protein U9Q72_02405 [Patescibacteria group bacterium]|nr:hypothetical protein [Patescibacteria group bacterium]